MALVRDVAAVIFDVDGTLVDSYPSIIRAWTTWGQEFGVTAEQLESYHGWPSEAIIKLTVAPELVDEATARVDELEVAEAHDVAAVDGALEALTTLPADRVAVATSGTREVATARLTCAGLPIPAVAVTFSDVSHGKPDPEIFLTAAAGLGIDPADCLVVEDAVAGVQAAKAAGCQALAVLTTTPREQLAEAGADAIVARLADVVFRADGDRIRVEARP